MSTRIYHEGIPLPKAAEGRSAQQNVLINLPADPHDRKNIPVMTGVLDYFPAAIAEVAKLSKVGNDQHNPGERLHWARQKSTDQADTIVRHLIQRGTLDTDGVRHSTKVAWRALALLQEELERAAGFEPEPPAIPRRRIPHYVWSEETGWIKEPEKSVEIEPKENFREKVERHLSASSMPKPNFDE